MEYGSMSIQRLQSGRWLNWGIRFFLTAALTANQTAGGYAPFALGCIAAAGPGADGAAALLGGVTGALLFLDFQQVLALAAVGILILTAATAFRDTAFLQKPWVLPVLAAPEHKLYAGALFTHGRWDVSTGIQYVAGLYTEVKVAGQGEYRTENFVLWNLRASFRAAKWLSVWVRGENLLAQRYEILAGFPMPRATVMAGVNMNF